MDGRIKKILVDLLHRKNNGLPICPLNHTVVALFLFHFDFLEIFEQTIIMISD